jgi:SAM-dependent methyltransferase
MLIGMCNASCIAFARAQLSSNDVLGRSVLEVGALDVNGSVRPVVEALGPATYVGIDIQDGPGVDELCDVAQLTVRYGEEKFDLVVSTELVEHVRDWRVAFTNMKSVLRPGGTILITTRSRGFPIHGYPLDYWRYELEDMQRIFADFEIVAIERDREAPGVFVKARKPAIGAGGASLSDIALFSVATRNRTRNIGRPADVLFRLRFLPTKVGSWAQPLRNRLAVRSRLRRMKGRRFS